MPNNAINNKENSNYLSKSKIVCELKCPKV